MIPGWFDKFLPWRQRRYSRCTETGTLCPSEEFTADLPMGKIPDRSDFQTLADDQRIEYWEQCVTHSRALAEEFMALLQGSDPLQGRDCV